MTIIILAAGYATRLYPLTLNKPKPLLKVGEKSIVEYIFDKIAQLAGVNKCYIVTNQKFFGAFKEWAENYTFSVPIEVVNDETTTNENRLGAIRDIDFVIEKKRVKDDILVIGGDNLFEFDLKDFVEFAKQHKPDSSFAVFDIGDAQKARQYGVVKLDGSNKVINFEEKPQSPQSTLISTCVYYFPREKLGLITDFLSSGNKADATGNYIKWLSETDSIYGFAFRESWYDIGDMKSLEEAERKYMSF
jgi:glucose-1-phosphate thymidylyltransferase